MTKTTEPQMVLCFDPYAGNGFSVRYGERLRTDDPRYIEGRFAPENTPDTELRAMYQRTIADGVAQGDAIYRATLAAEKGEQAKKAAKKAAKAKEPIPLKYQVIALRHVGIVGAAVMLASRDKRDEPVAIPHGTVADARWQLVKRNKVEFVPVLPKGVDESTAMVCMETLTTLGSDGVITRQVHKGTLVSPDDPMVELHPHMFQPARGAFNRELSSRLTIIARPEQVVGDTGRPSGYGFNDQE